MKTEDRTKAIVELDGKCKPNKRQCECGCGRMIEPPFEALPYLTSLDAIVPVIVKWCDEYGWAKFLSHLMILLDVNKDWPELLTLDFGKWLFKATPAQLCEALLRAAGKWTE